jgi:hypothetical protein
MPFCLGKYNMNTAFYDPTTINQVTIHNPVTNTNSIDWNFNPSVIEPNVFATSKKPLYTISGMWMEKFLSNTSQLWCTGYNIPNNNMQVVGIEFKLNILRNARIEDLLIQLTLNNELIGDNRASTVNPVQSDMYTGNLLEPINPVGDFNIYGSATDLWGTSGLTSADISDPTFGIVISFKSNAIYPHTDIAYIDQVGLSITYA